MGYLRIEIRIAPIAVEIEAGGSPERFPRARREPQGVHDIQSVLDVPAGLAAEDLVVTTPDRGQGLLASADEGSLQIACVDVDL